MTDYLKKLLGDKFKEDMSIEDIDKVLAEKNLVEKSEVDKMKKSFDKAASEAAKFKKELEQTQQAKMTEEEKMQQALEKAANAEKQYKQELSRLQAEKVFASAGLDADDYTEILDTVVTDDADTTKERAEKWVSLIQKKVETTKKAVEADLLKNTPTPPAGESGDRTVNYTQKIQEIMASGDPDAPAKAAALARQQAEEAKQGG